MKCRPRQLSPKPQKEKRKEQQLRGEWRRGGASTDDDTEAPTIINPLTPVSDQDRISPYSGNPISTRYVMRIKKNINLGIIGWSNAKFSELPLYKLYGWQ